MQPIQKIELRSVWSHNQTGEQLSGPLSASGSVLLPGNVFPG